jgi:hypothetical protein
MITKQKPINVDELHGCYPLLKAANITPRRFQRLVKLGLLKSRGKRFYRGKWQLAYTLADVINALSQDTGQQFNANPLKSVPPKMPKTPTYSTPGSEERIQVYIARVSRGEAVFHPGDENIVIDSYLGKNGGGVHHGRCRL